MAGDCLLRQPFIEDVARTWHLTCYVRVADQITAIVLVLLASPS